MKVTPTIPYFFRPPRWAAYLLAVGLTLLTLLARVAIGSWFDGPTMIVFTLPIVLSAYSGGLGPGLLATLVAVLGAAYYVLPPLFSFDIASTALRWQALVLCVTGTVISVICESLRRSHLWLALHLAVVKRADMSLRESEDLFSKAFRLSPDYVVISRLADRTIVRANEALCRLWGSTPENVIGKPSLDYSSWLLEEKRLAFMRTLQEDGECLNHETAIRLADGRLMDFDISSRVVDLGGDACVLTVMRDVTERKRTEGSAARLAAIVDSSDDAIIGKTLEGVITSWNASAATLFGYSADEMVWGQTRRLIPPERQQEETDILDHVRRGQSVRHFDTERLRKNGDTIDVSIAASPIKDAAGTIIGVSIVARDITERKQAEEARRSGEARLNFALETSHTGAWELSLENNTAKRTLIHDRIFGYDTLLPVWTYELFLEHVVPEDRVRVDQSFRDATTARSNWNFECRIRRADGDVRWIWAAGGHEQDSKGKAVRLSGIVQDITDRKQTEEARRESEERFRFLNDLVEATRTLADPAQIMAVMARMLGGHLQASRCAYADVENDCERFTILHDYTDGCVSTVGNYTLSLFGARAVSTLSSGQTLIIRDVEAELLPADGADMFNAIGIKAIITCPLVKKGVLRAMMAVHQTTPRDWKAGEIAIVRDVVERCWATIERRTAEETLHRLNLELEQRVAERTSQLETANQELEAFSYSVSHDLRAPLRAVNGFAEMVLEQFGPEVPAGARRYLDRIRNGSQQMGVLIDDLLAFSRLSRQSLNRHRVDTAQLVRHVLEDLAPQHEGRQIEIRTGTLSDCWGDRALLKQVWTNLLANAVKYSRGRELAVIEVGFESDNGDDAYFVRDNGTGFDMKYAHKLFGVFQRLHRADQFEGTGVGLAIVQRIIDRHGGRVWAESEEDQGATFRFTVGKESQT